MSKVKRKKIKQLEAMVADVIYQTPETTTLVLFTGNDLLEYQPGHFLTISPHQFEALERWISYLEDKKGKKEKPRAYSLSSSPDEKYLSITIKEERYQTGKTLYPPLLSPILAKRTTIGTRLNITGFTGPYTLPEQVPSNIMHICAGSGVVPSFSIIKYVLKHYPNTHQTLLLSNRSWQDTIFGPELLDLKKVFPDQLTLSFIFTRETTQNVGDYSFNKRIDKSIIQPFINNDQDLIFVCGPGISKYEKLNAKKSGIEPHPKFLESVLLNLQDLGISKNRIKTESYG